MSCRSLIFRNVYEYFKIQNVSEFLTNLIFLRYLVIAYLEKLMQTEKKEETRRTP